jgi:glycerophosphoryl diester phosphodiesterase
VAGAATLLVLVSCGGSDNGAESSPTTASPPPGTDTSTTEPAATEPDDTESDTETLIPESSVPESTATPTTESTAPPSSSPGTTEAPMERAIDRVVPPEAGTVEGLRALDRSIVIAHAGGDFEAPHSTMYAFTRAALAGADVLEMDVMLTADDVLVVHHDDTVDRTTEATGQVRDLTYDELDALDNAYWFVEGTWSDQSQPDDAYELRGARTGDEAAPQGYGPDDFRIETFRSVATAFPDHVLDVEIKVQRTNAGEPDREQAARVAAALADEIAALGRTDSVIAVSFDAEVIATFRDLAPGVATSPALDTLVTWYVGSPVEFAATDVVFQVPPFYEGVEVLTADVIERAQADGFDVWVWMDDTATQENADFYRELLTRGADGLLVSRPTIAAGVITAS